MSYTTPPNAHLQGVRHPSIKVFKPKKNGRVSYVVT